MAAPGHAGEHRDAAAARPRDRRARRRLPGLRNGRAGPAGRARSRSPRPCEAELHRRRDLEGETVLITAGPTQEPLDPVRFISNRSSGKMGYALAEAAAARGADVVLVSGPCTLPPPRGVDGDPRAHRARDARRGLRASGPARRSSSRPRRWPTITWRNVPQQKVKKTAARILAGTGSHAGYPGRTGTEERRPAADRLRRRDARTWSQEARRKLESKNCDMVVGNLVSRRGTGLRIGRERGDAGAAHGRNGRAAASLQAGNRRPDLRPSPSDCAWRCTHSHER